MAKKDMAKVSIEDLTAKQAKAEHARLAAEIAEIVDVVAGETIGNDEFSHAVMFRFESKGALERYLEHPEHRRVAAEDLLPVRQKTLALDFTS